MIRPARESLHKGAGTQVRATKHPVKRLPPQRTDSYTAPRERGEYEPRLQHDERLRVYGPSRIHPEAGFR